MSNDDTNQPSLTDEERESLKIDMRAKGREVETSQM